MKKINKACLFLAAVCLAGISIDSMAQDIDTPISPGQAQNPGIKGRGEIILINSNVRSNTVNGNEEIYRRIGNYKVKGNSYLLNGNNVSDLFSTIGYSRNLSLVYDTYTQQLGIQQPDKISFISLPLDQVDSFCLKMDNENILTGPMMFKNMTKIDPSVKSYMQVLIQDGKYNLYKSYHADMKNASDNIAQTNLKEFEIKSDYYFVDNSKGADKKLEKIKTNMKSLREYFKTEPEALKILDNPDFAKADQKLVAFFDTLNAKQ